MEPPKNDQGEEKISYNENFPKLCPVEQARITHVRKDIKPTIWRGKGQASFIVKNTRNETEDKPKKLYDPKTSNHYRANKIGGNYQCSGTIVAEFYSTNGRPWKVMEFDSPKNMMFILRADQIERTG